MRVVVNVAGRGAWLWSFEGDERALRHAFAEGRAPMHLLEGQVGPPPPYEGLLERILRLPTNPDAILEIGDGDGILYVGDDALRWSERDVLPLDGSGSRERHARGEPRDDAEDELIVAVSADGRTWTWRFPGNLEELEVELDEGRFPAHLGPAWRGRDARFVGRVSEEPATSAVQVELTGPESARFRVGGLVRDWQGRVERVEEEQATLVQLAARSPFEVRLVRHRVVGLTARADSDLDALALLLDHPESTSLQSLDLGALGAPVDRVAAAITARPRPELTELTMPGPVDDAELARIVAVAPRVRLTGP